MGTTIHKPVFITLIGILSIIISSLSLTPTTFCSKLPAQAQNTSVQFKLLNGSNRIAEAQQLLSIIVNDKWLMVNENPTPNTQYLPYNIILIVTSKKYSAIHLSKIPMAALHIYTITPTTNHSPFNTINKHNKLKFHSITRNIQ